MIFMKVIKDNRKQTFRNMRTEFLVFSLIVLTALFSACGNSDETSAQNPQGLTQQAKNNLPNQNPQAATPKPPDLQIEIVNNENTLTTSPIGQVDFKNFTYPLPRGWQDSDSKDVELVDGIRRMSEDKIGVSYVTTKFGDATGDGEDEAFVVLKIETAGSAIPQAVYVFTLKDNEPELIWHFRTGDRSDGGLKKIYTEDGDVVVELFGQDRYILGDVETMQITGDEPQICCPTNFTRTKYKWNGSTFRMQGKRNTYSLTEKDAPPKENQNEVQLKENQNEAQLKKDKK
jgi:hypothetical protein